MAARSSTAAITLLCSCSLAMAATSRHDVFGHHAAHVEGAEHDAEMKAVEVDAGMESLIDRLLSRHEKNPPSRKNVLDEGLQKMNIRSAAKRLESMLPSDMASLVRVSVEGKVQQPFTEESLAKARKYLNEMTLKSWKELDDELVRCKEFEDRKYKSWSQVKTQIATLAENIASLSGMKAQATEMINVKEQELIATTAMLKKETDVYTKIYIENKAELESRTNDLAVFSFMLKLVRCKSGAALAQLDEAAEPKFCKTRDGLELRFEDERLRAEFEKKLTPSARAALREVLDRVDAAQTQEAAALLQRAGRSGYPGDDDGGDDDVDDDGSEQTQQRAALSSLGVDSLNAQSEDPSEVVTTTTAGVPTPPAQKVRVQKEVVGGRFSCKSGPVDCGLLHDNMSLMWGKFKDLVDELQTEMEKNEYQFTSLKENFLGQLDTLRNAKAKFTLELNEAIANLASTQEELASQQEESLQLEKEYKHGFKMCKKKIEWIMFQDICSFIKVRAKVMEFSKVCPPEKIVDCGLSAWVPGDCSVPCDDACPNKNDPYACGGIQTLTREIVVKSNECGYGCAALSLQRKCNQAKCPVDCQMSTWSEWSKCTRECEGGARSRTRSVLVQPKNGGMACNTAVESEPCNTGSCDRDCKLKKWSEWSPCSVACGGGISERWRRVLRPIRGNGKCPKAKSGLRFGKKECNTHACAGDEVCIAKQDLIVSIDCSGSLRETGFKIIKGFAAKLVEKYKGQYYGFTDMQIGIVQFGNGAILEDGSISNAKDILPLSSDMDKVKKSIEGLEYMKGFTNMAQAFTVAEKLLLLGGRTGAQSAVMTLTDGKPSFVFKTHEKVMQLKDKHTKLFFVPVTEFRGKELKLMKEWASDPWETNLVRIPGLDALKSDEAVFAQKCLVKFCPEAISPSSLVVEEKSQGFLLIRENGLCGERGALLSDQAASAQDCAALATTAKLSAFSFGTRYAKGKCYGQKLAVTADMIKGFLENRAMPACPGGEWIDDGLYDFYVIEPVAAP